MPQLQEVYDRIKRFKDEQKHIREAYKNELSNSSEYQQLKADFDDLKTKKKEVEAGFKQLMQKDFEKLEDLKLDIETDNEVMSDMAFNQMIKGETVEIIDEYGNKYVPIFRVKFQKVK